MTPGARARSGALVWLLVLALLLVQTLGLLHGTVHGATHGWAQGSSLHAAIGGGRLTVRSDSLARQPAVSAVPANNWFMAVFSSHTSDADCRLYDQASHGSAALHVTTVALPVLLPSSAVAIFAGEALARWAALFDARGPPLTR